MSRKRRKAKFSSSERRLTECCHDFLTEEELDNAIEQIQKATGWGKQKITNIIKSLEKKGLVRKIKQGQNRSDIYILSDYPETWVYDSIEEDGDITKIKTLGSGRICSKTGKKGI